MESQETQTLLAQVRPVYATMDRLLAELELRSRRYVDDNFLPETVFETWTTDATRDMQDQVHATETIRLNLEKLSSDFQSLFTTLETVTRQVSLLDSIVYKLDRAETGAKVEANTIALTSLREQVTTLLPLVAKVSEHTRTLSTLSGEVDSLGGRLSGLPAAETVTALADRVDSLGGRLAGLSTVETVTALADRVGGLVTDFATLRGRADTLRDSLAALDRTLPALNASVEQALGTLRTLGSRVEADGATLTSATGRLDDLERDLPNTTVKAEEALDRLTAMGDRLESFSTVVDKMLPETAGRIVTISDSMTQLTNRVDELSRALPSTDSRLATTREALVDLSSRTERLATTLKDVMKSRPSDGHTHTSPNSENFVAGEIANILIRKTGLIPAFPKFAFMAHPVARRGQQYCYGVNGAERLVSSRLETDAVLTPQPAWSYSRTGGLSCTLKFDADDQVSMQTVCIVFTAVFPLKTEELFSCKDTAGNYVVVAKNSARSFHVGTKKGVWHADMQTTPRANDFTTVCIRIVDQVLVDALADGTTIEDCTVTAVRDSSANRLASSPTETKVVSVSGQKIKQLFLFEATKSSAKDFYDAVKV